MIKTTLHGTYTGPTFTFLFYLFTLENLVFRGSELEDCPIYMLYYDCFTKMSDPNSLIADPNPVSGESGYGSVTKPRLFYADVVGKNFYEPGYHIR